MRIVLDFTTAPVSKLNYEEVYGSFTHLMVAPISKPIDLMRKHDRINPVKDKTTAKLDSLVLKQ